MSGATSPTSFLRFSPQLMVRTFSDDRDLPVTEDEQMSASSYKISQLLAKITKTIDMVEEYRVSSGTLKNFQEEIEPLVAKVNPCLLETEEPFDAEELALKEKCCFVFDQLQQATRDLKKRLQEKTCANFERRAERFKPISPSTSPSPSPTSLASFTLGSFIEEEEDA